MRLTARCVRGLEWVLAAEVAEAAPEEIWLNERQVTFEVPRLRSDLFGLRTADDLFMDVAALRGIDHTRAAVANLAWQLKQIDFGFAFARLGDVRELPMSPEAATFDVVASLLGRRNYNRYAVEDAAGQVVANDVGTRYVSRNPDAAHGSGDASATADTDFTVRIALSGDIAEVAVRVPRKPLHRRPWKLDTGPGTLHPPLAAALVRIAGGTALLDPFCGDGTIAIEAALASPDTKILAADLDAGRLRNAEANAARAGVAERIEFTQADAGSEAWDGIVRGGDRFDALVTNPPWNRSVGAAGKLADTLDPFWQQVHGSLTSHGRVCTIAEADLDVPARLLRMGYSVALAQRIRLAGRVSHVVLAAPPDAGEIRLPAGADLWHERAIEAGIVSADGF